MKKYWLQISLIVILLASFLLMFFSAREDSLTVDEKIHISAGYLHVWQGDYTFNSEHPPLLNDLAGLFAKIARPNLPERPLSTFDATEQWDFGDLFFYDSGNDVDQLIFWARLPFILLTLGLIYLCFVMGRAIFGPKAGLLAAALAGFCPNILAHGRLATTDLGLAFFFLFTIWLLKKYLLKPSWLNAIWLGLAIGLAVLSKFSGLLILPIVLGGLIIFWVRKVASGYPLASSRPSQPTRSLPNRLTPGSSESERDRDRRFTRGYPFILVYLCQLVLIIISAAVLIWGVYLFSMRAQFDGSLISAPLNKFLQGWQILADHNQAGHWNYLNGLVNYQGWWYYFLYVLWYKLTLPVLILLGLAIIFGKYKLLCGKPQSIPCGKSLFPNRLHPCGKPQGIQPLENKKDFLTEYLIIFPPLLFLGVSLTSNIDIGIRHILPVLPFIFIFVSRLANLQNHFLKPLVWLLVGGHILVGIWAFPNYIAYFNQIAGGSQNGLKHLSDSNLDWNQNVKRFAKYAKDQNINHIYALCWDQGSFKYYGVENDILPASPAGGPNKPVQGVVVICAQQLVVPPDGFDFSWVTNPPTGGPPDDIIGHTLYVWRFDRKKVQ